MSGSFFYGWLIHPGRALLTVYIHGIGYDFWQLNG